LLLLLLLLLTLATAVVTAVTAFASSLRAVMSQVSCLAAHVAVSVATACAIHAVDIHGVLFCNRVIRTPRLQKHTDSSVQSLEVARLLAYWAHALY
jgi:hypothetical protein